MNPEEGEEKKKTLIQNTVLAEVSNIYAGEWVESSTHIHEEILSIAIRVWIPEAATSHPV